MDDEKDAKRRYDELVNKIGILCDGENGAIVIGSAMSFIMEAAKAQLDPVLIKKVAGLLHQQADALTEYANRLN